MTRCGRTLPTASPSRHASLSAPTLRPSLPRRWCTWSTKSSAGTCCKPGSGRRSRYHPLVWTIPDIVVAIGSLAALTVIVLMPAQPYNPYVSLLPGTPAVDRVLATLLLAIPAITVSRMGHATHHA